MVEFHHVISYAFFTSNRRHNLNSELEKLKPEFVDVIKDITRRMGEGMAEFMDPMRTVVTLDDYNLYTHYGFVVFFFIIYSRWTSGNRTQLPICSFWTRVTPKACLKN